MLTSTVLGVLRPRRPAGLPHVGGTFDPPEGGQRHCRTPLRTRDADRMVLITAQVLFVERPDAESVRLDVIVLDRAEAPMSPPVGAPIAFGFGMPSDEDERDRVLTVLRNWARRGAAVDMTIRTREGVDVVVLRSRLASVTLQTWVPHGTGGGA